MPRKVNDSCMFCLGAGCEVCSKPAKKASPKSQKSVTTVNTILAPDADSATVTTKPDVKAAMKAVSTSQAKEGEDEQQALLDALVALEPILHRESLEQVREQLDSYKSPAERWRWRREQRKL